MSNPADKTYIHPARTYGSPRPANYEKSFTGKRILRTDYYYGYEIVVYYYGDDIANVYYAQSIRGHWTSPGFDLFSEAVEWGKNPQ